MTTVATTPELLPGCTTHRHATREDWLFTRRSAITATDAAAILGVSPWKTAYVLWASKLGLIDDDPESEAMRWGTRLEPLIAERYAEETGRELVCPQPWTLYCSTVPGREWQATSLDRVVVGDPRGLGLVECKTTSAFRAGDWADGVPEACRVQVQHELAVTGCAWASVAVLIGGQQFLWTDLTRDDTFIYDVLLPAEAAFWQQLVTQTPPEVDGSDAARAALHARYPREAAGTTIALPPEADAWDAERQAALQAISEAEARKATAENHLKALIGDAERGSLPCGVSYQWKTVNRREHVVAASACRVLRRVGGSTS